LNNLLTKLNYKDQPRIAIINAGEKFLASVGKELKGVQIDIDIDQRFLYDFMIIFAELVSEVELMAPKAIHNLASDGILWLAYPKKTSKLFSSDIDRDHGWEVLIERGFDKIRLVAVDDDWSALRFRNVKFIKSNRRHSSQS
jgi:hypothetical protein